jgi:phosphatidylglycerol lysyltransferase
MLPARPSRPRSTLAEREDLAHARELVLAHGRNATCYQILNPGFHRWFAPEGDAVVGYVPAAGVRVVGGGPVCSPGHLTEVVEAFEEDAVRRRRRVCYFGAEEPLAGVLRARGPSDRLVLGAQPLWSAESLVAALVGKASLRAQVNRARNKGVTARRWSSEQAMGDHGTGHPGLARCLADWLATRGLPPMHFLVEPETLERLADRRVFVAERDGVPVAFLVASPIPARRGWLIEQIVRGSSGRRMAPNGTSELLLHAAALELAAHGAELVTLGLAPLSRRGIGADGSAHLASRPPWPVRLLLSTVRRWGRRFYDFEGLEAFKAKFLPDGWEPVYAIAGERRIGLRTLYAIAGAFGGASPPAFLARATLRRLAP